MRYIIALCSLMFPYNTYAADLEKVDIEKCSYQGGKSQEKFR